MTFAADLLRAEGDVVVIPLALAKKIGLQAAAFLRQAAYLSAVVEGRQGWFFLDQEGEGDPLGGKPAAFAGDLANLCELLAPHRFGPGNIPVGIALAHAHQSIAVLIHLEPPFSHDFLPAKCRDSSQSMKVRAPDQGSKWRLYAGNLVAPLRRQSTGAFMPETK